MRFITCSFFGGSESDRFLSESPEIVDDDGYDSRANGSKSKNRVPSKVVEDQIRRLMEKSRRQTTKTDSDRSAEAYDRHSESLEKKRTPLRGSRRRSFNEDDRYDWPADEEAHRDRRRTDRKDKKVNSRTGRLPDRDADRGEDNAEERPENRLKRIDKATIRHLVKNKSFINQFKRKSNEQNELLNDPKVQIALKRIRDFAEKEKLASEKRKTRRRAASGRADSNERRSDERPRAKRKRSSRSYRISEDAKASKSVIDNTKKFEELNRGMKKMLTYRKKDS